MAKYNAHHTAFFIHAAILWPACNLTIAPRFLARARMNSSYGPEDWFAVSALAFFLLFGTAWLCSS